MPNLQIQIDDQIREMTDDEMSLHAEIIAGVTGSNDK